MRNLQINLAIIIRKAYRNLLVERRDRKQLEFPHIIPEWQINSINCLR